MNWQRDTVKATYDLWYNMHARCYKPQCRSYKHYGRRGIKVCPKWHDFLSFVEEMGLRPEGMTLERMDNDGDYELSNCKWATHKEQAGNRSNSVMLTLNDRTMCAGAWAAELDLPRCTVMKRIRLGYPVEQVLYQGNLKHYKP